MIRLQRVGKKNEPTFRIVLTDSKNGPKSGKFLEILGSYDARDKNESKVKADRVLELVAQGAQLSDTVHNFLITKGVIEGKKINALPKKTPIVKEVEEGSEEAPKEDAPAAETETPETPAVDDAPAEEVKEEVPAETPKEDNPSEEKTEETPKKDAPVETEEAPKEEAPAAEEEKKAE